MGVSGILELNLTDAPIVGDDVASVFLTFQRVEVRAGEGRWIKFDEFEEPVTIDLLAYQNGESYLLSEEELPAGDYNEIRLVLNMNQEDTYILYKDNTTQDLKVPSGSQSGFKIKGDFNVPAGGEVSLTLDWDLRRSIVEAGNSGQFILKPVARLVTNQESGSIQGFIDLPEGAGRVVVYAYADGTYAENENLEQEPFPNAISSAEVALDNGQFTLAYLESGIYDLYFAHYDEATGDLIEILGTITDVEVEPGQIVQVEASFE